VRLGIFSIIVRYRAEDGVDLGGVVICPSAGFT